MNHLAHPRTFDMKHFSLRRRNITKAGFSLVEVALAVAIAALAIITLLGLLPQGLEMSRKTALLSTNNSILEQVVRNLENMQWDDIKNLRSAATKKYYTDEGLEVSTDSKEISYVVQVEVKQINDTTLPATGNQFTQEYLARAVIKLASTSNTSFTFNDDNKISYVVFNHLIAKSR